MYSPHERKEFPLWDLGNSCQRWLNFAEFAVSCAARESRSDGSAKKWPFPGFHPIPVYKAGSADACSAAPWATPLALPLNFCTWTKLSAPTANKESATTPPPTVN